ncbi:MAG: hypothetical protein WCA89_04395 [Terracidiphilus sp.]|jgi:hypothetical protein
MKIRNWLAVCLLCGIALTLSAQQSVAPPPKPANDAPANAEVLKLLRAGMSESVVLNKIRATTDKFDTSADALVALKQAGANDAELSAVLAQGTAPADAQPAVASASTGPSLADTMQYIQDNLNNLGKVSFVVFLQDANDGSTWTQTGTYEISNFVADQNQCHITYHLKFTSLGKIFTDENLVLSLRDVQDIVAKPWEQSNNEWNAQNGHPNWITTSTNPPITELAVRQPHGKENTFRFYDANLADRVARALTRAVELCGSGNKEKF